MKPKVSLIALGVEDIARSLAFYRDGLGLSTHNYKDGDDCVFFAMEGTFLAIYPRDTLAEDAAAGARASGFRRHPSPTTNRTRRAWTPSSPRPWRPAPRR